MRKLRQELNMFDFVYYHLFINSYTITIGFFDYLFRKSYKRTIGSFISVETSQVY